MAELQDEMARSGISVEDLAKRMGSSRSTLYRKFRSGGGKLTAKEIRGIMDVLHMSRKRAAEIFL